MSETSYGPSPAALDAAGDAGQAYSGPALYWNMGREGAKAAHDPALGLDASVNMGQIIARIKRMGVRSPDLIAQTLEAEAAERANRARANAR